MPMALVKALCGSPSIVMPAAAAPVDSPQAPITKGSLTETQMISSTPLASNLSLVRMKLGTWALVQVEVKAPGTAKITTLRPLTLSATEVGFGPSAPSSISVASGSVSPADIVIVFPRVWISGCSLAGYRVLSQADE